MNVPFDLKKVFIVKLPAHHADHASTRELRSAAPIAPLEASALRSSRKATGFQPLPPLPTLNQVWGTPRTACFFEVSFFFRGWV